GAVGVSSANTKNVSFDLSVFGADGGSAQAFETMTLRGGSVDLPIHELVGSDAIGLLEQRLIKTDPTVSTELIRVFPHQDGGIGYIMNVPTTVTSESSSGGSSSGSSSSGSSSSSSGTVFGSVSVMPSSLSLSGEAGAETDTEIVRVKNTGSTAVTLASANISGADASLFSIVSPAFPVTLPVGGSTDITVSFTPPTRGDFTASLTVTPSAGGVPATVPLSGHGLFAFRMNGGGEAYVDTEGHTWAAEDYFVGGEIFEATGEIDSTEDDALFQTERYGLNGDFGYSIPVLPEGATYMVTLHFAEIFFALEPDKRLFDVFAEGQQFIDDFNVFVDAGDSFRATSERFRVTVTDGKLDLELVGARQNAKVSAIEIVEDRGQEFPAIVELSTTFIDFGGVVSGSESAPLYLKVANFGDTSVLGDGGGKALHISAIQLVGSGASSFEYIGSPTPLTVNVGEVALLPFVHHPNSVGTKTAEIKLVSDAERPLPTVALKGLGLAITPLVDVYRGNAGGSSYLAQNGLTWSAGASEFTGGRKETYTDPILQTGDDPLYQSEYFGFEGGFEFSLPVQNGEYQVTLHFAELFWDRTNRRIFDVKIEGATVIEGFDILTQQVAFAPVAKTYQAVVNDGRLDISFIDVVDRSKVSAIVVQKAE
ncbi:MAG: choice-of-anchor D domain-containing protein, partial [Bdellovibrionales bacterium]|nr:choice-of-anchor D domain-containing protein [Bdellovibrionales bacterium]